MNTKERSKSFIASLSLPVSRFCKNVSLSETSFYRWQNDDLKLSAETTARIDSFLKRYGW